MAFFRNCSVAPYWGTEKAMSSKEGESSQEEKTKEENIREEDDDANKENKIDEAEDCLWSLTTDAGISRRTTVFRIGVPVVHHRYKEQEKEGDFDVK